MPYCCCCRCHGWLLCLQSFYTLHSSGKCSNAACTSPSRISRPLLCLIECLDCDTVCIATRLRSIGGIQRSVFLSMECLRTSSCTFDLFPSYRSQTGIQCPDGYIDGWPFTLLTLYLDAAIVIIVTYQLYSSSTYRTFIVLCVPTIREYFREISSWRRRDCWIVFFRLPIFAMS